MLEPREIEGVRLAGPKDVEQLADITAEAFAQDPVVRWTFNGDQALKPAFKTLAEKVYLPRGLCHLAGDAGATMWLQPGARKELPLPSMLAVAATALRHGGITAITRALAVDAEMIRRKPKTPHAYLFTIAVRTAERGKGVGPRLLAPVLAACDAAGLPAYLENSNPANFRLYEGHGFKTIDQFTAAPGCPPLWPMWREPGGG